MVLAIEPWIVLVDDAVVIGTDDNEFVDSLFCERVIQAIGAHADTGMVIPLFNSDQSTVFCIINLPS